MNAFEDVEFKAKAEKHQRDVQNFMDQYIQVLKMLGGDELVKQMQLEVRMKTSRGAELGEALAEHYLDFKRKHGL